MFRSISAAAALAAGAVLVPITAPAATGVIVGTVVHVSADNIKVRDKASGKVLSFVLIPHFKKLFAKDGKTTEQMSALTPGTPVTVYYDQKALGIRHADRILINGSVKSLKG